MGDLKRRPRPFSSLLQRTMRLLSVLALCCLVTFQDVACVPALTEFVESSQTAGVSPPLDSIVDEFGELNSHLEADAENTQQSEADMDVDMILEKEEEEKMDKAVAAQTLHAQHQSASMDLVGELRDKIAKKVAHGHKLLREGIPTPKQPSFPSLAAAAKAQKAIPTPAVVTDGPIKQPGLLAASLTKQSLPKSEEKEPPIPDYHSDVLTPIGAAAQEFLHSKAPIIAHLTANQKQADVSKNTGLKVKFSVENPSSKPLKILKWETPFEGLLADMFKVHNVDGDKMKYVGPDARRAPPYMATDKDFLVVKAKGSESIEVDLASMYEFTKDGDYFIRAIDPDDGHLHYKDLMNTVVKVTVVNTKKQAEYRAQDQKNRSVNKKTRMAAAEMGLIQTGQTLKNCDAAQTAALKQWEKDAKAWLEKAEKCTTQTSSSNALCSANVNLWFGKAPQSEYAFSVTKALKNMLSHFANSDFDCNGDRCGGGTFAYVYPSDDTQEIFMCPFTFTFSVESEKRQTVIHELSHFNHIGVNEHTSGIVGERDLSYGEKNCQDLAKSDPTKAMNNADNMGYFVRDIGLSSDPSCIDKYSSCASWVKTYDCNKQYKIDANSPATYLYSFCQKSCKKCNAVMPSPPPPPPSTATTSTRRGATSTPPPPPVATTHSAAPTQATLATAAALMVALVMLKL